METCAVCLRDVICIQTSPCKDTSVCAECYYVVFNYPQDDITLKCPLCLVNMSNWHIEHTKVVANVSADTSYSGLVI